MLTSASISPCLQQACQGPAWRCAAESRRALTPCRVRSVSCASQTPEDERRLVDSEDAPSMAAELGGDVSGHASAVDYTVAPEQPLSSVDWHGHTGLVVVDAEGRPVGVLSDKNVKASSSLTVRDVMTPHPVTILETAPVAIAAALMKDHGIHRLPLVNRQGRCVGMLTRNDIFRPAKVEDPLGTKWAAAEKRLQGWGRLEKEKGK